MIFIGIIGSAVWTDVKGMRDAFDTLHAKHKAEVTLVISGHCETFGMARAYAESKGWEVRSPKSVGKSKSGRLDVDGVISFLSRDDKLAISQTQSALKQGFKIWIIRPFQSPQVVVPEM
jgi:hypothetical protein